MKAALVTFLSFFVLNLSFSQGLVFSVLDKEVMSLDGKSLKKDPVQTVISTQGGNADGKQVKVVKTLTDETGKKTPVIEEEITIYGSRELALKRKPQGSFGYYLKNGKSFVIVGDNHWGKSAVLYHERDDGHLDSLTVENLEMLIDINPHSSNSAQSDSRQGQPVELEHGFPQAKPRRK